MVEPEIEEIVYKGQDIKDKKNKWNNSTSINDPACYIQGAKTEIEIKVKLTKKLTYDTNIEIKGNVSLLDDDNVTGGNYKESYFTIKKDELINTEPFFITSESNCETKVQLGMVDITWEYKVPVGTNSYRDMGDTDDLDYFLIVAKEKAVDDFNYAPLKFAVTAAEDQTVPNTGDNKFDPIRKDINDAIYEQYIYSKNCDDLSSNFVIACKVLGIEAETIMWSNSDSRDIGSLYLMSPRAFKGAGGTTIPNNNYEIQGKYWWSFHQWAQSGDKIYDPSSGVITNKSQEEYEDIIIEDYLIAIKELMGDINIDKTSEYTKWVGTNYTGQSEGCERTGEFKEGYDYKWKK